MVVSGSMGREKTFNIRFSDEEWARLEYLAAHYGLNATAVIRMLMKKEEDAVRSKVPMPKELQAIAAFAARGKKKSGK